MPNNRRVRPLTKSVPDVRHIRHGTGIRKDAAYNNLNNKRSFFHVYFIVTRIKLHVNRKQK